MGRHEDAAAALRSILVHLPDFAEGWAALADTLDNLGRTDDAVVIRAKRLLDDPATAQQLLQRFGLIKRIDTAEVRVDPTVIGGAAYFACTNGDALGIDIQRLQVTQRKHVSTVIRSLVRKGRFLRSDDGNRRLQTLFEFTESIELPADPQHVDIRSDPTVPWSREMSTTGASTRHLIRAKGGFYATAPKGAVWKLTSGGTRKLDTSLEGVNEWEIELTPAGAFGFDHASVYELNKDFVPVRRLIDQRETFKGSASTYGTALRSDGRTLCYVHRVDKQSIMQVWSLDGTKLIAQQSVSLFYGGSAGRLVAMDGGYFLVGDAMVWIPANGKGQPWRFALNRMPLANRDFLTDKIISSQRPPGSGRYGCLTSPVITAAHVLVGHAEGGVYVFDRSKITGVGPGQGPLSPAPTADPVVASALPAPNSAPPTTEPAPAEPAPTPRANGAKKTTSPAPVNVREIPLAAPADNLVFAGAGRFFIFELRKQQQIVVFDAIAQRFVRTINVATDNFRCAAGLNMLMVVDRAQGRLDRWDLTTFQRDRGAAMPELAHLNYAVMGEASNGPLLMVTDKGKMILIDPERFAPITARTTDDKDATHFWLGEGQLLVASADGSAFSGAT